MTKATNHPEIEERFPRTGFVYIGDTRIMFATEGTIAHEPANDDNQIVVLCEGAGGWSVPTASQRADALIALVERYGVAKDAKTGRTVHNN